MSTLGRLFNFSSTDVQVKAVVKAVGQADRTVYYLLLAGCESPPNHDVRVVQPVNAEGEILDEKAWALQGASAHIVDIEDALHIFGLNIEAHARFEFKAGELGREGTIPEKIWVTVLGAGIAGLSAAHELVERGFQVQVVEKNHSTPVDETAFPLDEDALRFTRGFQKPDVGGIARTQWSTAPMSRGGGLLTSQNIPDPNTATLQLNSVHGATEWQGELTAAWATADNCPVPFSKDRLTEAGLDPAIQAWLNRLNADSRNGTTLARSIAAVQAVVIVYRDPTPGAVNDQSPYGVKAAYDRYTQFVNWLAKSGSQALTHLKRLEVFPTARMEIDLPVGSKDKEIVGLLLRHHESLGLIAGEHGFRFFPGFYQNLRDTMRRTPIFDPDENRFTSETVHDKLTEVTWQVIDDPLRRFPGAILREKPNGLGAILQQYRYLREDLGYRPSDVLRFCLRLFRYATSSTERRALHYEQISWWDFLSLRDVRDPGSARLPFGERFDRAVKLAPEALLAMKAEVADARTQGNISLQLAMDQLDLHDYTDSTLKGPTSESWFGHWRDYLEQQGVRFFVGEVTSIAKDGAHAAVNIEFPAGKPGQFFGSEDLEGTKHFYVCAMDAPAVKKVTGSLFAKGDMNGTPARLGELVPVDVESLTIKRDPGTAFQNLTGIQLYYPQKVSFENAHIFYADSAWGLSAVSQIQFWGPSGTGGARTRLLGNLSVDIGAWFGRAKAGPLAWAPDPNECDPSGISTEVLKQIGARGPTSSPPPSYFHIDDYIQFTYRPAGTGPAVCRPTWNRAPFLINLSKGWEARPEGEPFSPSDRDNRSRIPGQLVSPVNGTDDFRVHKDGGYWVHYGNLVFAGAHMRTFTRLGTMEAANESGRHAVNALLDFLSNEPSVAGVPGPPQRPDALAMNRTTQPGPAGRPATPYGDYCEVWNPEENEFIDLDFLKLIDRHLMSSAKVDPRDADDVPPGTPITTIPPHLCDLLGLDRIPDFVDNDADGAKVFTILQECLDTLKKTTLQDSTSVMSLIDTARKQFEKLKPRA